MTYPTNQIPSVNPQNIALAAPIGLQRAPRDPTASDNIYPPGFEWQNTVTGNFFKCISATIAGAHWQSFVPNSTGNISTLDGNSGGVVGPDGSGNLNVVGDSTTITIAGNAGTNTLTASLVGGGVAAQSFVTNIAGPVTPSGSGGVDLNTSTSTYTDGTTAHTIKTEVQGTNHALFVGRGALSPATTIALGTSGQALISGGAGSDPAFGILGVADGGTGDTSFTAYAVVTGGTSSTGALQNVSGVGSSGQVLTSNGAGLLPTWQAVPSSGFSSINIQTFTTPGAGTYTPTASMKYCIVEILGAGGAGGGGPGNANGACSGGSAGGYSRRFFSAATIGVSQTVTVGAGGTGSNSSPGTSGGTTSFGAFMSATGGAGGIESTSINGTAPLGGVGTGGDVNMGGDPGTFGLFMNTTGTGTKQQLGGNGGGSVFGGGGSGYWLSPSAISGANGGAATANGAGGGGAIHGSFSDGVGGDGGDGIVIVTEFI